jgi:diguanylate cyclase (GGDEF)-like protein/PAS domain S-box-containing protein
VDLKKSFSDLVDIQKLQKLLHSLYDVTGVTSTIMDRDLTVLTKAGWSDCCAKFHSTHPATKHKCHVSTLGSFKDLQDAPPMVHQCLNGLYHCAYPIMVGGEHLATLFFAQFLLVPPDEEFFRQQALTYGFNEEAYLNAIREVPVVDKEKIVKIMRLYADLAIMLADLGVHGSEQGNMLEFLQQLMDAIPNPIFYKNTAGSYLGCNKAFEEFMGRPKEELVGHSAAEMFPAEVTNVFTDTDSAIYETAGIQSYEYRLADTAGNIRDIYTNKAPFVNAFGKVAGVVGVIIDMTERIKMEQALKESEAKYKAVFQYSLSGFMYFKALRDEFRNLQDYEIIEVNDAFERLTGVDQREVVHKRASETILDAELNGAWKTILQDIVLHKSSKMFEHYFAGFGRWFLVSAYSPQQDYLAIFFADIDQQKRNAEQAQYEAHHDALTGLSNRRLLEDKLAAALQKAQEKKEMVAVMFIDMDELKGINDRWGHEVGDQSLQEVARRIKSCIRDDDNVSRFGGDEFVLLIPALKAQEEAIPIAHRILETCRQPLLVSGEQVPLTVSVGLSFYPQDGEDATSLIRNADHAMYVSKKLGRDRISFVNRQSSERNGEA